MLVLNALDSKRRDGGRRRMTKLSSALGLLLLLLAPACATSFQGNANISPGDCATRCREIGGHMDA